MNHNIALVVKFYLKWFRNPCFGEFLIRYLFDNQSLISRTHVKIKNGSRYRGYEYQITDYGEYEDLKSSIDKRLEDILLRIKELSSLVVSTQFQ